jgi:hypothetical protein
MFKILGADGKEYGPVAVDQIIRWIGEGRANHETMMQRQGEFDWKPLSQFAEFAEALGVKPPVVAPPPSFAPAPVTAVAAAAPAFDARAVALQKASGPAIGLMITAGLGLAMNALSILIHLLRSAPPPPPPGLPPNLEHLLEVLNGPMGIFFAIFGLAISGLVLFGAIQMQKLSSRGLAMTAAILALVPCFSPCCVVGLPIGIWALVVLLKPEVSSQFD